jgi:hypothetical protein
MRPIYLLLTLVLLLANCSDPEKNYQRYHAAAANLPPAKQLGFHLPLGASRKQVAQLIDSLRIHLSIIYAMRIKKFWPLLVMLPIWFVIYYSVERLNRTRYADFTNTAISGKLVSCKLVNHGFWVTFSLADSRAYTFAPVQNGNQIRGASAFIAAAANGDSVWKARRSDTLLLIKKNRIIKYAFAKAY